MVLETQWSGELRQQQNTQKKGYRQWMDGVYEEMTSSGGCGLVPSGCGLLPGPLKPLATCFLQEGRSPSKPEPRGAAPTAVSFPDHHVTCLIGQFVNMRVWEWDHTSCCCGSSLHVALSSLLPPPPPPLLPPSSPLLLPLLCVQSSRWPGPVWWQGSWGGGGRGAAARTGTTAGGELHHPPGWVLGVWLGGC